MFVKKVVLDELRSQLNDVGGTLPFSQGAELGGVRA